MSARISTQMLYNPSLSGLFGTQQRLAQLQKQLDSGQKILSAKDDPVAAAAIIDTERALAVLQQGGRNADAVQHRLGLQDNALDQVGELLNQVNERMLAAADASLSADDRKSIALELHGIRDGLLALANSRDGQGRFLFAGTADQHPPFSYEAGRVHYHGNHTQRQIEIAPGIKIKDTLPGTDIFMRIRSGNGILEASADATNTGTAVITGLDGAPKNAASYFLRFAENNTWEVRDRNKQLVESGTWTPGESLVCQGIRLHLEGIPAKGDGFEIGPARTDDVFTMLDELEQTLCMDSATPGARAVQQNRLQASLRSLSQAREQVLDARTQGGAQLKQLETTADLRAANSLSLNESLSALRNLDYAQSIGDYKLQSTALQASQLVFTQMQAMSLFNVMR